MPIDHVPYVTDGSRYFISDHDILCAFTLAGKITLQFLSKV